MIRCLFFDMGNVLVHFSHEQMFRQMADVCSCSDEEIRKWLWDSGWQQKLETGQVTAEEVRDELSRQSGRSIELEALLRAGADIFTLNEPLLPVLDALKEAGYRMVVLSNTSVPHVEWIRRKWDVLRRFDTEVLSCEVGALKPDVAIYEAALAVARCEPQECFFTDDIAENVEAARDCGMRGEVFEGVEFLVNHLRALGLRFKTGPLDFGESP